MSNLKVLVLGRYGHPADVGGVANATRNIVQRASEEGLEFRVYSVRDPLLISQELLSTGFYPSERIKLRILPTTEGFGTKNSEKFEEGTTTLADRITEFSACDDIGLVHVITAYPNYVRVGEKISANLGVPYIVSARGSDVYGHNPEVKYYPNKEWFLSPLRNAALIIVLSDFQEIEVRQNLAEVNCTYVPIKKIRNGVDTNQFVPLEKIGIPDGAIRAAYTGRIRRFKRVLDIIKAVHSARTSSIDIEFDVYGKHETSDEGVFEEIWEYIKTNNLSSFVRADGNYVPNNFLPEIYRRHNLFVHASICEGHSNCVMEAMSCGLAVSLNYASGSSDLLKDGNMIFESGNIESMVRVFLHLSRHPHQLTEHGLRNREFALAHHWIHIAQQYCEIYGRISKANPKT